MANNPKFRQTTIEQEVRKADGKKPHYYPQYEFAGRTFMTRDQKGPKKT